MLNMEILSHASDSVHWFVNELGARVVAETGIPSDRFHFGKMILRSLKDAPDFVMQIDGATGESETFKSVLERSVRCAESFKKLGLKTGDNIVLMAPNHIDLTIPCNAALYLGVGIALLDRFLTVYSLTDTKQLRGGVIFMKQLPMTASTKVHRQELKKLVLTLEREMEILSHASDSVHWFVNELGARVVAETGIPSDRFHFGKMILRSLKDAPDFVLQIDGTTGESETFKSVLERSVRCAESFKKLGLKTGDNIVLMAPNHLHLTIPYYAALYLGIGIAALDAFLTVLELEEMFKLNEAKVVFCQNERVQDVKEALKNVKSNALIVTFNDSDDCITFSKFLKKYEADADVENFRANDFDPAETIAKLVCTSGTTGTPKAASLTHKNFMFSLPYLWLGFAQFPCPTRMILIASPLQWLSAGYHFLFSPILRVTRLQTSANFTPNHFVELVNKYRPTYMIISPPLLTIVTKSENIANCDISCFEYIIVGGSAVSKELLRDVQKISPKTYLIGMYGMSEIGGIAFYDRNPPPGSMGKPMGLFDYRIMNPGTKEAITEPHVQGELWYRGPSVCKGYYNNPEVTKESFEEGGWIRSGDIFYRDENYNFFFVDRLKLLLKYRNHQISPTELEAVIRQHPAILDVAVTGISDPENGDLPVACVVPKSGHKVTAQEIKDIVKDSLTDSKQLRGGVIFMNQLPMTASTKVHRHELKKLVLTLKRE